MQFLLPFAKNGELKPHIFQLVFYKRSFKSHIFPFLQVSTGEHPLGLLYQALR